MKYYIKHNKWIGSIVYPFLFLITLSLNGQNSALNDLLEIRLKPGQVPEGVPSTEEQLKEIYIENLHDILSLIFNENDSTFNELKSLEEERIEALNSFSENSPWNRFLQAEIKLQWAFIKLKYGEEWGAFWSLRKASKLIEQNNEEFPSFNLNKRTTGLLNILFGVTPENYQWVFSLFGMKGEVKTGIDELVSTKQIQGVFGLESNIILGMVYSHLLEEFKLAPEFIKNSEYSDTPLANYFQGIILQKSHQSKQARQLWESDKIRVPFKEYLIGETYFQEGEYPRAILNYIEFINHFSGNTYQKDAYLKIALAYKIRELPEKHYTYLNMAKTSEANSSEVDKNAQKILDKINTVNINMLRLRFAIDGGYYDQADRILQNLDIETLSPLEKIELVYRQARQAHLEEKSDIAIDRYREVIKEAELIEESYFAPNSYLQLGYLQRDLGNIDMAQTYLEKVLTFKKHPYKMSLDSKAKVALSLLNGLND